MFRNYLLLLLVLCLAAPAIAQEHTPSEVEKVLVDRMRWDHIERTRPLYLSSSAWQTHCDTFYGEVWKTKCQEKRQSALTGEAEVQTLLKKFDLETEVRSRGWAVFYMPIGLLDAQDKDPLAAAWISALYGLLTGYSPPNGNKCAQYYPCTLIFRFDQKSLSLMDIDFIALPRPPKQESAGGLGNVQIDLKE